MLAFASRHNRMELNEVAFGRNNRTAAHACKHAYGAADAPNRKAKTSGRDASRVSRLHRDGGDWRVSRSERCSSL
jgi:hypothetical protein